MNLSKGAMHLIGGGGLKIEKVQPIEFSFTVTLLRLLVRTCQRLYGNNRGSGPGEVIHHHQYQRLCLPQHSSEQVRFRRWKLDDATSPPHFESLYSPGKLQLVRELHRIYGEQCLHTKINKPGKAAIRRAGHDAWPLYRGGNRPGFQTLIFKGLRAPSLWDLFI